MPLTRFPNGVTVNSTTALQYNASAGDGDIDCNNLFVNNNVIGQVYSLPIMFAVSSAAQSLVTGVPFAGNIIGAYVVVGSVSAIAAAYTVRVGSAGSVAVASVSNTVTNSGAQEGLTTTTTAITTANGITATRGVQGTAGDSQLIVLVRRTS